MWQARVQELEDRVKTAEGIAGELEDRVETAEGISGELEDRVKVLEGIVKDLQMSGECSVPTTPEGDPGPARVVGSEGPRCRPAVCVRECVRVAGGEERGAPSHHVHATCSVCERECERVASGGRRS